MAAVHAAINLCRPGSRSRRSRFLRLRREIAISTFPIPNAVRPARPHRHRFPRLPALQTRATKPRPDCRPPSPADYSHCRAAPWCVSTGPALPIPMPCNLTAALFRAFAKEPRDAAHRLIEADAARSVGHSFFATSRPASSTTPTAILVPPMSTAPIICRSVSRFISSRFRPIKLFY